MLMATEKSRCKGGDYGYFLNGNRPKFIWNRGRSGGPAWCSPAPILCSQILQQMYSIADCMIVGHFGGGNGLAAAGEAALILSVIINFFVGFSTGVSAITASAFGGFQYKKLSRILHSVILMSLFSER